MAEAALQGFGVAVHRDALVRNPRPCRPTSTGRIDIASPDPAQPPRIQPNYLGTAADVASVQAGARLIGRLQKTPALRGLTLGAPAVDPAALTDDALLADFRARSDTPMNQPYLSAHPKRRETVLNRTRLRRLGDPTDIASAAAFLASDESRFMTGASLVVDGWLSLG